MKKLGLLLLTAFVLASCASSDDEPQPQYPRRGGGGGRGGYGGGDMRPDARPQEGILALLPPDNWWHDPQVAAPVKLSDPQYTALEAIAKNHTPDIDRLRMDTTAAERDLRLLLSADKPTANDIVTAGERLKKDRDDMLDHQLRMLADERELLTHDQWTALQNALRDERQDNRGNRGGYGPGGMGRRGGGRRPGF